MFRLSGPRGEAVGRDGLPPSRRLLLRQRNEEPAHLRIGHLVGDGLTAFGAVLEFRHLLGIMEGEANELRHLVIAHPRQPMLCLDPPRLTLQDLGDLARGEMPE